jgi:hypothetical protein
MGTEYSAGANQTIVVYVSADTGEEVDPLVLYRHIADDAATRAGSGQRIVSMSSLSLRHAQAFISREGSGYETKVAVTVVYAAA